MGYFKRFGSGNGIEFMDGRTKGDLKSLVGQYLHIQDYGFIRNSSYGQDDYAVVAFAEYPAMFFFGNSILTEMLHEVENDGMQAELRQCIIIFEQKLSKNGRDYLSFTIIEPEQQQQQQ